MILTEENVDYINVYVILLATQYVVIIFIRVGGRVFESWVSRWRDKSPMSLTAIPLTRPMAAVTERCPSRSVRIPFGVPTEIRRWRVVIRNANYRTNRTSPGAFTIRTIVLGVSKVDDAGVPSSAFACSGRSSSGCDVLLRDVSVADLGAGFTTPWIKEPLHPDVVYLLGFGYQTNGQEVHTLMGGGWQTNGLPMNAELDYDPSAARAIRLPCDIRIEFEKPAEQPVDVIFGDSIAAGSNASFPIREAPLMIANNLRGRCTRLHTYGGASFNEWVGGNWGDLNSLKWQEITRYGRAEVAYIALGNNDIHAGTDLSTLQARLASLLSLVRERVAEEVVVCTVTPRAAWVGTEKEALRTAFNAWLRTLPYGLSASVDTAAAVEDKSGHAPRPDLTTKDGIHFNSSGSRALAAMFRSSYGRQS